VQGRSNHKKAILARSNSLSRCRLLPVPPSCTSNNIAGTDRRTLGPECLKGLFPRRPLSGFVGVCLCLVHPCGEGTRDLEIRGARVRYFAQCACELTTFGGCSAMEGLIKLLKGRFVARSPLPPGLSMLESRFSSLATRCLLRDLAVSTAADATIPSWPTTAVVPSTDSTARTA